MESNFSKPQRQSAVGVIIMAANGIQKVIRATFIPVIIFVVKAKLELLIYIGIGVIALIVIVFIFAYLNYLKFTFFLDENKQEFVINKGIFTKTLLTIPLEKIQQVNINQSILQKIVGVHSLQIDTAGATENEVSIKAIAEAEAYRLKDHLLNGKKVTAAATNPPEIAETKQTPFIKISSNTLLKVGLTSNYGSSLWLLIGFAYAIFHNIKDIINAFDKDNGQVEAAIEKGLTVASAGLLVAALLFILLLVNIIRTFIKYYDYQISQHQQSLLISSGLLAKKNTLLNLNKVQSTVYSQNYFQRKMNMLSMELKQIYAGIANEEEDIKKTNLIVPGCNAQERDQILYLILGNIPKETKTFKPNFRFLNLPLFFKVLLPLGIFIGLSNIFKELGSYYPLAILYVILVVTMIFFSYKRHRLSVNQNIIIKKSGIWDISFEHIFPHKIQAITTSQYPWHKGIDVGHVNLHTAAGIIHFKYGNFTEIKSLVNYWLYQIESGSEEWM